MSEPRANNPTASDTVVRLGRALLVVVGGVLLVLGVLLGYFGGDHLTFAAVALLVPGLSLVLLGCLLPRRLLSHLDVLFHMPW